MGKEEILGKIDHLIEQIFAAEDGFEERDIVYLLVEIYKIKERELKSERKQIKDAFPHISFYRDWVVHTHLHNNDWYERKNDLGQPDNLKKEFLSLIENEKTRTKIVEKWPSFLESLRLVVSNQDISPRETTIPSRKG